MTGVGVAGAEVEGGEGAGRAVASSGAFSSEEEEGSAAWALDAAGEVGMGGGGEGGREATKGCLPAGSPEASRSGEGDARGWSGPVLGAAEEGMRGGASEPGRRTTI